MSLTNREALDLSAVALPAHLIADAEVPMLAGVQAQGDLLVVPWATAPADPIAALRHANRQSGMWHTRDPRVVPVEGVRVVGGLGENAHILHRGFESPDVVYAPVSRTRYYEALGLGGQTVGCILVPEGQTAVLVHTDEHGSNGIAAGAYLVTRKRELQSWSVGAVDD